MEITWTFAVLEALALAVVKAIEGETSFWGGVVNKRLWLYLRAVLVMVAFVASQLYPEVPDHALVIMGTIAMGLAVLGYWPEAQKVGMRIKGGH